MAGALTYVLLVASGQAGDPTTQSVARSTHDALGPEARLEIRETAAAPTDADALDAQAGAHPDAVIELRWVARDQAVLRVLVARDSRWVERTVGFAPTDAPVERGRTLGFAAASMLPLHEEEAPAGAPPPAPSPSAPVQALSPPPEGAGEHPPRQPRAVLDALAIAGVGIGGTAEAFGAAAGVHWFALPILLLRVGVAAMAGTVSGAQASSLYLTGSGGLAVHPFRATAEQPFGLSLRCDFVLAQQSVSRSATAGPGPTSYERSLSGFDAVVEGDWLFAPDVELLAGVGLVDLLGPTYLDVQGARVATIPAMRGVMEIGVRLRF